MLESTRIIKYMRCNSFLTKIGLTGHVVRVSYRVLLVVLYGIKQGDGDV